MQIKHGVRAKRSKVLVTLVLMLAMTLTGCNATSSSIGGGGIATNKATSDTDPATASDQSGTAQPASPLSTTTASNPGSGSPAVRRTTIAAVATTVSSGKNSKPQAGPASLYPDPKLTPGDVFPGVTKQEVCVSGYSKSVRSVSQAEKDAVYSRYGIVNVTGQHEVDHFISLELGGSNDLRNLWPEPYDPRPGAHEKDTVENALHTAVCNGTMSLTQAQNVINQDWYAYYLQIKH